jgi:hypothetical protein
MSRKMPHVGLLHPGEMGSRIGMALLAQGASVLWCSEGRGEDTKRRASKFDDVGSLSSLVHACDSIVSVCPPSAARSIAQTVADLGFTGFYCDANAINPDVSADIGAMVSRVGGKYVDGSIISFGGLRLYLSGQHAAAFREQCFPVCDGGAQELRVVVMQSSSGVAASALKAAYSGWDKAVTALTISTHALAMSSGIHNDLMEECRISQPAFVQRTLEVLPTVPGKAWRFVGEMEDDAKLFSSHGLPAEFNLAAKDIFERLGTYKNAPRGSVSLEEMARAVLSDTPGRT